jgi:hypothetical protein
MAFKNREEALAYNREYYRTHKHLIAVKNRDKYVSNPAYKREQAWKRHGIELTHEHYEALLVQQAYCCAICGVHASELPKALAVDHNHETGKVRGLLCDNCNKAIGLLKDEPLLLEAAAKYLSETM